ncbi:hypothetical protein [Roseomonas elaeocarpi]|uniref:Chaperone modulatory protein CbpM n=1 Tax=Roseomonas elaeocarpi TaxID=907779 RepID=A0ABV6JU74_9PROT
MSATTTPAGTITVAAVLSRFRRLDPRTLEGWIASDWVRPSREGGETLFRAVDVARLGLILELRDELELGEPAIPVVLSLVDQLHDSRRQMRRLRDALGELPEESLRSLARRLSALEED